MIGSTRRAAQTWRSHRRGATMPRMNPVLTLTHQTGRRLAEIGFLLLLFAGVRWAAHGLVVRIAASHRCPSGPSARAMDSYDSRETV